MGIEQPIRAAQDVLHQAVFPADARDRFARQYPERPHTLRHSLGEHPLLSLDALAALAERHPAASIEYH